MFRKGIAGTVMGTWAGAALIAIGAYVRGDRHLEQPGRDLATGAGLVGAAMLLNWAATELANGR